MTDDPWRQDIATNASLQRKSFAEKFQRSTERVDEGAAQDRTSALHAADSRDDVSANFETDISTDVRCRPAAATIRRCARGLPVPEPV